MPIRRGSYSRASYFLVTMSSDPKEVTVLIAFMDYVMRFEDSLNILSVLSLNP